MSNRKFHLGDWLFMHFVILPTYLLTGFAIAGSIVWLAGFLQGQPT